MNKNFKKFLTVFAPFVALIIAIILIIVAFANKSPVYPERDITQYHNIDFSSWENGRLVINNK